MKGLPDTNAKKALEQLKLEIANEFDAKLTDQERTDGTMVRNLVDRAVKKMSEEEQ